MRKSNPLISVVINADTRPEKNTDDGLFNGTVNLDYLTDGIANKIKFFSEYDTEIILFIDKHQEIPEDTLRYIQSICDVVVIRKHTHETNFNDFNYITALFLARGKYIAHFDQDTFAFAPDNRAIESMLHWLEQFDYISYPSHQSPAPCHDDTFDHWWASTRFFICKRATIDFTELRKCQEDYDYWLKTYPVKRACHWTEHLLGSISKYKGKGVFYPPMNINVCAIFTFAHYEKWTLRRLNEQTYDEIKKFIADKGHIQYPNDIRC